MDHDSTGSVVSGGCDDCGHNHCDFDLNLPHNFKERYQFAYWIILYSCISLH